MQIKNFKPRLYQESILNTAINNNTLIILPTGLGKTKTAILIAINRLNKFPNSKILFLTPTKPLASQIQKEFQDSTTIPEERVSLFTGAISPPKRQELWKTSTIIVSTPQGCSNDIVSSRISLKDISLLVFDEAHRSTGDYDYNFLAKQYSQKASYPRIIGLTASPGSDIMKIEEVCKNLFIESIEIRTDDDPDVKPYVKEREVDYILVDLPDDFKQVKDYLDSSLNSKLQKLKDVGFIPSFKNLTKKDLLSLQKELQRKVLSGERNFSVWHAISLSAEAIKVHHALELLETQTLISLHKYLSDIFESASKTKVKAVKSLVKDLNFKSAFLKTQNLIENNIDHPKLARLKEIIKKEISSNPNIKIIVFSQYRGSVSKIASDLNKMKNIKAKVFVGQAKKANTGLSQKQQLEILDDFKNNLFNIVCMTSVGEEGLDIPAVDLVIFFEPIPSAIRTIQRRGRTARQTEGRIIVLVTKNTRDESYRWVAYHKEKRMYRILSSLKNKLKLKFEREQTSLKDFSKKPSLVIHADNREKSSGILKELVEKNVSVSLKNLAVGDYIISERVAVEFKTKSDFINSIIDKRLLKQAKDLKKSFERPLLIIQGTEDIYSIRNVHPNAIQGMLATIAVSYNIPIIFTKDYQESASLIMAIARREQEAKDKDFSLRTDQKPLTTKELQEFIVESFPGVGPSLAKSLLKQFRTVKKIVNSKESSLQKIEKLGPKKAKEIKRILEEVYEGED